jgi:hypothetical protein
MYIYVDSFTCWVVMINIALYRKYNDPKLIKQKINLCSVDDIFTVTHKPMCYLFYYPEQKYCDDLKLSTKSNCNKNKPRETIT